jgi:hypothetical protein
MDNKPTSPPDIRDAKPTHRRLHVSRTRLIMALLLLVAIPIFISLANRALRENADAIQQSFGR